MNDASSSTQSETSGEHGDIPAPSSPTETIGLLERAEKLNKETLEAEKRIAEHRRRIEEIETKRILGGQSNAGQVAKTPEQLKAIESDKIASDIVNAFKRR